MELKQSDIFEFDNGTKYEVIQLTTDFIILQQLAVDGSLSSKKVKYPVETFQALIKNKSFEKVHSRRKNDFRDLLDMRTDSDMNLRDMSKK